MKITSTTKPILINGGGIGGLATALALARHGVDSRVFEQASEFKEVGAGLQIGPNAFRVFEQLGVTEAIAQHATFPQSFTLLDAVTAEQIVQLPLGSGFEKRFGYPYGLMHRADLHRVLLDACRQSGRVQLNTNSQCVAFTDTGDGVEVTLASESTEHGSALVGADGLWVGPKMHMVLWPMRKGAFSNVTVVFHSDRVEEGWDTFGDPDELHERMGGMHPKVRDFVHAVQDWRMYVLRDRDPIRDCPAMRNSSAAIAAGLIILRTPMCVAGTICGTTKHPRKRKATSPTS